MTFLPPNTTSVLQPLDLGIIWNFKIHYRKLLTYVLSKIEESTSAAEIVEVVDVLQAIRWIAQAWMNLSSERIKKCFRNAGILNPNFDVSVGLSIDNDPFEDLDDNGLNSELNELVSQVCSHDDLPDDPMMYCNFD